MKFSFKDVSFNEVFLYSCRPEGKFLRVPILKNICERLLLLMEKQLLALVEITIDPASLNLDKIKT